MSSRTSFKLRIARIAVLSTALLMALPPLQALEWVPGEAWKRTEVGSRVQWTWGLTEGQSLILEELPPAQRSKLKNTISIQEAKLVSEIMTDLYADSANAYIPWKYMAVVARMRLAGEQEALVVERLRLLRQYSTDQRKASPK
jgi:hypothetical protein